MSRVKIFVGFWITCLLLLGCVNTIIEDFEKTVSTPVVRNETIESTTFATIAPPSDFVLYQLPGSAIGVYIPEDWIVTGEIH